MGIFIWNDTKEKGTNESENKVTADTEPAENQAIKDVEQKLADAEKSTSEKYLALGKQVFAKEKDNTSSEYRKELDEITECMAYEALLAQYRMHLDGKLKCENCGRIITSDSDFCNKCGVRITPPDFSPIEKEMKLGGNFGNPQTGSSPAGFCSACGAPLQPGMMFCEKCGAKNDPDSAQPISKTCPSCGNPINPGARFCEVCGAKTPG